MSPRRTMAGLGATIVFGGFIALGTWQIERRAWKLDLIARVDERVHAAPMDAPPLAQWPRVTAAHDEYRHVRARGVYVADADTWVQAVTDLGAGFWVLTPLKTDDGSIILINRGFVPQDWHTPGHSTAVPAGPVAVIGLLRMTEPGGAFLRHNDAVTNRWYSRDVHAIAMTRHLTQVAPYFIDAGPTPMGGSVDVGQPTGGLTAIAFHNSHLVYALTWYTLAVMTLAGLWIALRRPP